MAPTEVNSWIVRVQVFHALIDQKDEVEILRGLPQGSRLSPAIPLLEFPEITSIVRPQLDWRSLPLRRWHGTY